MNAWIRSPRCWLVGQMIAVAIIAATAGMLRVKPAQDTASYVEASETPLAEMLQQRRTLAYPLFLSGVAAACGGFVLVPLLQLLIHFGAVFWFDSALRQFGASAWTAWAASSGLLLTVLGDGEVAQITADSTGRSAAIVAMSCLLWVCAPPRSPMSWLAVILSVAVTYHLRPVYLFLIPLVPCLGLVLLRLRSANLRMSPRWFRFAVALSVSTAAPFLAFCTVRLALVGHFGLVSFGGYNVIGIAVEFLDEETIDAHVAESWRPLARDILHRRNAAARADVFLNGRPNIPLWELNYNSNVYQIAIPAATEIYGDNPTVVNRAFTEISHATLLAKKRDYLAFVALNLRYGIGKCLNSGWLLMALGFSLLAAVAGRALLCPASLPAATADGRLPSRSVVTSLVLAAFSFAACKLLIVGLVEVFISRYIFASTLFMPPILAIVLAGELRRASQAFGSKQDRQEEASDHDRFPRQRAA